MAIKAVIFDIDGTLIDSVDAHARAWQEAFAKFGVDLAFETIRSQIGKGGDKIMPTFLTEGQMQAFSEELEAFRADHFRRTYLPHVPPFPAVRQLFEKLRADGIAIALASSCNEADLETYKEIANIGDLLETETTKDDVANSKPDPDIFQRALDSLDGVAADEAVVVGDSPYDAEAALKIGLRPIGVRCGGFPESDLRQFVKIFDSPDDMLRRYDAWMPSA